MFQSMADVKAAFPNFFAPDTMRFFRSRIESSLYAGTYFITSEQFVMREYTEEEYKEPRGYTIHKVTARGIDTVGEFNKIPTLEEARAQVRQLVKDIYTEEEN